MNMTRKVIRKLRDMALDFCVWLCYPIVFTLVYRQNFWNIYRSYHKRKSCWKAAIWNRYMRQNGGSISIKAQIAAPLILPHGVSGIFITQSATIGRNVVIFQQVTIGANTIRSSKSYGAPTIGDNVYIGAGAKIIGAAQVGDNARIGANAVVVRDIPYNALAVCAEPRIIIKERIQNNTFTPYLDEIGHISQKRS
ncbi:MAG: serine acetyltransferase [Bacteroidaceae bacterium]|nr:serine acetyltransferase [Bacteroidaceae bacterium]